MKKTFYFFSLLVFLSFTTFSCSKEEVLPVDAVTADENTEVVELGVLDRGESYFLSWTAGNGIDVQYQVINTANNQVLFTRTWVSFWSGNHTYTAPDDLCVKAVLKAKRANLGPGLVNLNWNWKRATCPLLTGTYGVTAPYGTSWASIPPYYMANPSCPCQ